MEKALSQLFSVNPTLHLLSGKEKDVLIFMASGMNSKQTGSELNVLSKSIDNYKGRIIKKMGLKGYGALKSFVRENKVCLLAWGSVLVKKEI